MIIMMIWQLASLEPRGKGTSFILREDNLSLFSLVPCTFGLFVLTIIMDIF